LSSRRWATKIPRTAHRENQEERQETEGNQKDNKRRETTKQPKERRTPEKNLKERKERVEKFQREPVDREPVTGDFLPRSIVFAQPTLTHNLQRSHFSRRLLGAFASGCRV
jgi:hypothetical protein